MKLFSLVMVTLVSITLLFSTNLIPDSPEYNAYKLSLVSQSDVQPNTATTSINGFSPKFGMSMLIPRDETFTLALDRNDDGSTDEIPLPWTFNLYGTPYESFWINNNGNVTFDEERSDYSSSGFPDDGNPMLAAFWADVDTRHPDSGLVYYRIQTNPNRVVVIWEQVGYYNGEADKLNTFSIIFTDGTDPLIGIGNNVVFSYGDMQWTTGSASGGVNGFLGTPATVGINKGTDDAYTQAGRFDQPGDAYDGGHGDNDGVDWLDDRDLYLAASGETILIVLPTNPDNIVEGPGLPPNVPADDPSFNTYTATYDDNEDQTVTIAVGAGRWRGWIFYTGAWHQADVFPYVGPGFVVFSNVPFSGGKDTKYVVLDLEDEETLPVQLSSFTASVTAQNFVKLNWVTQSENNLLGYRIYRGTNLSQTNAILITPTIIAASNTSSTCQYTLVDNEVVIGSTYWYWIESVEYSTNSDFHGPVSILVQGETPPVLPEITSLRNAYPNPFKLNSITNIEVDIKAGDRGTVTIYNVLGQNVKTFKVSEGFHKLEWNGIDAAGNQCGSGVYFVKLSTPSISKVNKMLMIK